MGWKSLITQSANFVPQVLTLDKLRHFVAPRAVMTTRGNAGQR
jgi:hypothetical protein